MPHLPDDPSHEDAAGRPVGTLVMRLAPLALIYAGSRRNGCAHTVATIFAPSVRQRIYAFIATSVRFFAFIFLMTLRTWTFTVLKHMFNS